MYARLREIAVKASLTALAAEQSHQPQSLQDDQETAEADFFHDGSNVLDAIQHWHNAIRQSIRTTDHVTPQVLDLVTERMLQGNPKHRISATDLCTKLTSILDSCPEKNEFIASSDVQKAWIEVQTQTERLQSQGVSQPSSQIEGLLQGRAARDARKSYNVQMARMRSEYFSGHAAGPFLWPSSSLKQPKACGPQNRFFADCAANQQSRSYKNYLSIGQLADSAHGGGISCTERPISARIDRTSATNQHKVQDVFQARHELEAAEESLGISGILRGLMSPSRKKDSFLADLFQHRDIVSWLFERLYSRSGEELSIIILRSSLQTTQAAWRTYGLKLQNCSTFL